MIRDGFNRPFLGGSYAGNIKCNSKDKAEISEYV